MDELREVKLGELLVEFADTLTADFDLVEFLTRLATRYVDIFDATEAGVILTDARDRLHVVASSSDQMHVLELYEIQNDEGPCLDALRIGEPVINVELAAADARWPQFAPEARQGGFTLVHAFPMNLRDQMVGVLNVFSSGSTLLSSDDARVGQALADVATIGILQERAVREGRLVTEQLQRALSTRVVIEQAKGMLSERTGLDMSDSFELLRGYARRTNARVGDVAREVLGGDLSIEVLQGGPA